LKQYEFIFSRPWEHSPQIHKESNLNLFYLTPLFCVRNPITIKNSIESTRRRSMPHIFALVELVVMKREPLWSSSEAKNWGNNFIYPARGGTFCLSRGAQRAKTSKWRAFVSHSQAPMIFCHHSRGCQLYIQNTFHYIHSSNWSTSCFLPLFASQYNYVRRDWMASLFIHYPFVPAKMSIGRFFTQRDSLMATIVNWIFGWKLHEMRQMVSCSTSIKLHEYQIRNISNVGVKGYNVIQVWLKFV
jgi:hypothetical protein